MAPSEHPMASRLVDRMGIGFDVGNELLSFDCLMPTRNVFLKNSVWSCLYRIIPCANCRMR